MDKNPLRWRVYVNPGMRPVVYEDEHAGLYKLLQSEATAFRFPDVYEQNWGLVCQVCSAGMHRVIKTMNSEKRPECKAKINKARGKEKD